MGRRAGWMPANLSDITDRDLSGALTPQEEEDLLLGPDEPVDVNGAYKEGYRYGLVDKQRGNQDAGDTTDMPYRSDTEAGRAAFDQWLLGRQDAYNGKPPQFS